MSEQERLEARLSELAAAVPTEAMSQRAINKVEQAIRDTTSVSFLRPAGVLGNRLIAASATTAAAAVLFGVLLFSSRPQAVAYAQVVDNLAKVKTVQYTETRSVYDPGRDLNGPQWITKVTVVGRSRERREVVRVIDGDPLPDGEVWGKPQVGTVSISNTSTGKYVTLDLNKKTFSVIQGFVAITDEGNLEETKPAPAPEVDFYHRIRDFETKNTKRLADRRIDGRSAVGFSTTEKIKQNSGIETWTRTVWVDSNLNLPVEVEIEIKYKNSHEQAGWSGRSKLSGIVFDEPVDESLVSTDPPEGYVIQGGEGDQNAE